MDHSRSLSLLLPERAPGQVGPPGELRQRPLAELAAGLDDLRREERQAKARAWRDQQARHEAADGLMFELESMADLLTEATLTLAGFHRHDRGPWRRRRMTNKDIMPTNAPLTPEDVREVLAAARKGDRTVLPALRRLLDNHPEIWQAFGDLAAHAEMAWVDLAAGPDLALGESIARKIAALKAELTGPTPSPLERILVDRVAACWVQVHHADAVSAQSKDRDLTLTQRDHLLKRQERAGRSYLAAIKTLAVVKKLIPAEPRPPEAVGREYPGETLRREAGEARRSRPAKSADEAPEAGKKNTTKDLPGPTTRYGRKVTQESAIPEPLRRRMRGLVASEN